MEYEALEKKKVDMDNEKEKMLETMMRIDVRLEEEVNMRLMFESKINSLHMINNETVSEVGILTKEIEWLKKENKKLIKVNSIA